MENGVLSTCRGARWGPLCVLAAVLCLAGTAPRANASIIPTLVSVTQPGGAGTPYIWLYSLTVDTVSTVQTGDYFVQADLGNIILGTTTSTPFTTYGVGTNLPGTFTATELPTSIPVINPAGPPPTTVTPGFNKLTTAVEVLYLGAPNVVGTGAAIGDYAFESWTPLKNAIAGGYGSQDHNTALASLQGNLGQTLVPGAVPVSGAHTAVIGLFGSTLFWFRMRRKSA